MRGCNEIELQNRDKWCKEFEEQELKRYFREKYCQHMFNQALNNEANRLMGYGSPYGGSNMTGYVRGYY